MMRRLSAFALSLAVLVGRPAQAQQQPADDTPPAAEVTTAPGSQPAQADPQDPAPADNSFIARLRRLAQQTQIIERINGTIDGWYPRFGGMTRGSGFVLGPGYRTHILGDRALADFSAALSTRWYKAADAKFRWARALHERVELWTDVRLEDYPQEDFYGTGPDSALETRTSYDFASMNADARVVANLARHVQAGARLGVMTPSISHGTDDEFPSIEEVFTDAQAPGLAEQPNYTETSLFLDVDTRDPSGNPGYGGLYHASFGFWNDRTLHRYDFKRFDVNAQHYVALTPGKRHVLSGRFGLSTLNNKPGDRVPFYFFPYVGGSDTVRSLHEFRFRDENAIWIGAEYTWTPFAHLSLAGFVDAGKVTHTWDAVGFGGLTPGYGVGVRIHTPKQRLLRVDIASGGHEGWRTFIKLGPSF